MKPTLFEADLLGSQLSLGSYATFMVLAWVAGVAVGTFAAHKAGLGWRRALPLLATALLAGVVGARLFDLWIAWDFYSDDRWRIAALSFGGFSLYGGLLGAGLVGWTLARRWRFPVWRLADAVVPGIAVGVILMRCGCFLNGCCFGKTTSLPWGVTFPGGSSVWIHQMSTLESGVTGLFGGVLPVHPTQLYEALAAALLAALALWIGNRLGRDGASFLIFAAGFTLFRIANGLLRVRQPVITAPEWFYPVFYGVLAAGFVAVLISIQSGRPSFAAGPRRLDDAGAETARATYGCASDQGAPGPS